MPEAREPSEARAGTSPDGAGPEDAVERGLPLDLGQFECTLEQAGKLKASFGLELRMRDAAARGKLRSMPLGTETLVRDICYIVPRPELALGLLEKRLQERLELLLPEGGILSVRLSGFQLKLRDTHEPDR